MSAMEHELEQDRPFCFMTAARWKKDEIRNWLLRVTRNDSELEKLWMEFLDPHLRKGGTSLPVGLGTGTLRLSPMKITLNGVVFEVYSSWCALAAVLNRKLPPFDPEAGNIVGYAFSILVLFAKWTNSIKGFLPGEDGKPWAPIVFSVSFAEKEGPNLNTSNNLVTIISANRCVSHPQGEEKTKLIKEWGVGRMNQLSGLFDREDNPLVDKVNRKGMAPTERNVVETRMKESTKPGGPGPVTRGTLDIYYKKQWTNDIRLQPLKDQQTFGVCAEAWGMIMMKDVVKSGGHFTSISITCTMAEKIELLDGYKLTGPRKFKIKPPCYNCVYIYSAIEARYGIVVRAPSESEIGANYFPTGPPTSLSSSPAAESSETPEEGPSSLPVE